MSVARDGLALAAAAGSSPPRCPAPSGKVYLSDATCVAWLDLRSLELGPSPAEFFRQSARVALSDGA